MKKFLIEFFRPIDTLIFNYLVRFGLIKPFFGFLASALLGTKVIGTILKKKTKSGTPTEKVFNVLRGKMRPKSTPKLTTDSQGGEAVTSTKKAATITAPRKFPKVGPLLRSETGYGVTRSAGPLRSPAGGGAGSAVSPGGYGVNFARKEKKRKVKAALGYGSKIS